MIYVLHNNIMLLYFSSFIILKQYYCYKIIRVYKNYLTTVVKNMTRNHRRQELSLYCLLAIQSMTISRASSKVPSCFEYFKLLIFWQNIRPVFCKINIFLHPPLPFYVIPPSHPNPSSFQIMFLLPQLRVFVLKQSIKYIPSAGYFYQHFLTLI